MLLTYQIVASRGVPPLMNNGITSWSLPPCPPSCCFFPHALSDFERTITSYFEKCFKCSLVNKKASPNRQ